MHKAQGKAIKGPRDEVIVGHWGKDVLLVGGGDDGAGAGADASVDPSVDTDDAVDADAGASASPGTVEGEHGAGDENNTFLSPSPFNETKNRI